LPARGIEAYTQGLMDLGATVCARGKPRCDACPVARVCIARRRGTIGTIPAPRPRKDMPQRRTQMLVLMHAGNVLLEKRGKRRCPADLVEFQIQHQVFRFADGLADREAPDARLRARISEAVECRLPEIVVVDRMLDPERDHRPVLSLAAFRRAVCCQASR
jgi:adenine-specific DNA glycosylase